MVVRCKDNEKHTFYVECSAYFLLLSGKMTIFAHGYIYVSPKQR